jgi:hypothetical protein
MGFRTDCVIISGQGHDISWKSMELLSVFTYAVTKPEFQTRVVAEQDNHPQTRARRNSGPKP